MPSTSAFPHLLLAAAGLSLAACGPTGRTDAAAPQEPRSEASAELRAPSDLAWDAAASGEGVGLRLGSPAGDLVLSIACLHHPPRLEVRAPGFQRIGSEDRFSLGLDDDPIALVADLESAEPGVVARGAINQDLVRRINGARRVSALYGTQQIAPVPMPTGEPWQVFIRGCGDALAVLPD
jgi:hypothetical protein